MKFNSNCECNQRLHKVITFLAGKSVSRNPHQSESDVNASSKVGKCLCCDKELGVKEKFFNMDFGASLHLGGSDLESKTFWVEKSNDSYHE